MIRSMRPPRGGLALALAVACAALLAACGGNDDTRAAPPASAAAAVHAAAASGVARGFAGAAAGLVTPTTITTGVAGLAVLAPSAPVVDASRFSIGSNTKAMTAVLAARLVERGTLRWDTRIADAMPELQATMLPVYANVTLEQLLDHRGGLHAYTDSDDIDAFAAFLQATTDTLPTDEVGRRHYFVAHVLQQQPPAGVVPGTTFLYSNAGYALAAAMLERVTGQGYEALFDAEVARPLGLVGHWGRPELLGATQPHGYWGDPGQLTVAAPEDVDLQDWLDTLAPAGLWATTPQSYGQWLQWHLVALRGGTTPLPASYVQRLKAAKTGDYVMGWQATLVDNRPVFAHDGAIEGFLALAAVEADGSVASFVMSNTSDLDSHSGEESWVIAELNALVVSLDEAGH